MNLADIIAIIIVVLMIFWGIKKGMAKAVLSLGSLILSLILALTLYPAISDFLSESVVGDYVHINVYKVFETQEADEPNVARQTLNLPQSIEKTLADAIEKNTNAITETVAETVAGLAIKLLSILVVFVLVKVILWIISALLNLITKLPVIHSMNKLLGGVMGCCYGILIVYLLLALLTFTTTLKTFNKPIELVLKSRYVSTMYNQNILLNFLK